MLWQELTMDCRQRKDRDGSSLQKEGTKVSRPHRDCSLGIWDIHRRVMEGSRMAPDGVPWCQMRDEAFSTRGLRKVPKR